MGKSQRDKGQRIERELVHLHLAAGVPCERVPLSGAAGGSYSGDLLICGEYTGEVKARASGAGWKVLEGWLIDNDMLFLRRDRQQPLVLLPWGAYTELMRALAAIKGCLKAPQQPTHATGEGDER